MEDRGTLDKVKGRIKEAAGDLVGDHKLEAEGNLDQAKGKAKETAANIKDAARDAADKAWDVLDGDR